MFDHIGLRVVDLGLRAGYGPSYFAAFLVDPDGNNVEAMCLTQEQ